VTPSVAAPGDTNPNDTNPNVTDQMRVGFFQRVLISLSA